MKNCEYCDYCKTIENGNDLKNSHVAENMKRSICLFTDTLLFNGLDNIDEEYPCRNVIYQEYLDSRIVSVNITIIMDNNWRALYKTKRKASAEDEAVVLARAAV